MNDDNMLSVYRMAGYYSAFQARFTINESPSNVFNLKTRFIGKCPQGTYRLLIYAYNYNSMSWEPSPVTSSETWLNYEKTEIYVEMDNLPYFPDFISPTKEVLLLYVMEMMDTGMKVDYVELEVVTSGGTGGEMGMLYDFMDSAHQAFSTSMLTSTPPSVKEEVNGFVDRMQIQYVDGYQHNTGFTPSAYSGFRAQYNSIMENPSEISKIKVYFRAATDNVGDLKTRVFAWNMSNFYESIGDPIYISSMFMDYEVEISSFITSYIQDGTLELFLGAEYQNRPIIIDYTAVEVFMESGLIFDFM